MIIKPTFLTAAFYSAMCLASAVFAQDMPNRPILSERHVEPDVVTAIAAARERSVLANQEQIDRFSQFEGAIEDFKRTDPVLQQVSWPYGTCTDLHSLVPPPFDGWGLRSETLANEIQETAETFFVINYVTFDQSSGLQDDDLYRAEQTVSISINGAPEVSTSFEMQYANPDLRNVLFVDGPYGYPVLPYDLNSAVLGQYLVRVTGTGEENATKYFQQIVRCAIDNGLIAKGIDPETLQDTP